MTQSWRNPQGGVVDRAQPLQFEYDGARYEGCAGDTLASALLANGVHLVGRSFKYHRPRGIVGAGVDEPNALVQLARGARTEPNVRATTQELYDGLVAASQNCWPSVRFDIGAINGALSRFMPSGFYYKTFMWPPSPRWWLRYEHVIRRAAGTGRAASEADPDHYEHQYGHCDVLVIGAGPAGLAAARAAAHAGARVMVCDENPALGGNLTGEASVDGEAAAQWIATVGRHLASHPDVTLLPRTTAFGYYDGSLVGLIERVTDHLAAPPADVPRQRLWKVRAGAVVLASGAHERGIAYANNDLPGTLLAGAARIYAERYAVRAGTHAVVFTNNDSAHGAALALHGAGVAVEAIIDARPESALAGTLPRAAMAAGLPIVAGAAIAGAHGARRVSAVDVLPLSGGRARRIPCDLVCVSGGWNPAVHLYSQARGSLRYDEALATFLPGSSPLPIVPAGAANGRFDLAAALADGHAAGLAAAARAGCGSGSPLAPPDATPVQTGALLPTWSIPARRRSDKRFVDPQNDVTVADIALAAREGYRSVELLKRYTTLGMGSDQGKPSNVVGLALLAEQSGVPIAQVGTTTFRPPYTPVTLGAFPGHATGTHVEPTRLSAMHDWHVAHGARFVNAGLWKRPHSYPRGGESADDAASREAKNVRSNVGVVDVSTLGKIELQGADVAEFLNRVYINRWDTLAVGRCRYGVMLRDDGIVLDDGTTSRLATTHYLMTTTTVNAGKVMQHLERLLQVDWPELEVFATSVTEQWAAAALSGPKRPPGAREAGRHRRIERCLSVPRRRSVPLARRDRARPRADLPHELLGRARLRDPRSRRLRPRDVGGGDRGRRRVRHHALRHRSDGHAAHRERPRRDRPRGRRPHHGGRPRHGPARQRRQVVRRQAVARARSADRPRPLAAGRPDDPGRHRPRRPIPRAAKIVADPERALPNPMLGHVTSWCWSPNLEAWIALALLANGRARHGETLWAVSPLANAKVQVKVGPPCFIDPEGERLHG